MLSQEAIDHLKATLPGTPESSVWAFLAYVYGCRLARTPSKYDGLYVDGICLALSELCMVGAISWDMRTRCEERIHDVIGRSWRIRFREWLSWQGGFRSKWWAWRGGFYWKPSVLAPRRRACQRLADIAYTEETSR